MSDSRQALRDFALGLPETQEGIACAGTVLETNTVTVRNKAFLFLGMRDLRLKLGDSLPEASALATREPARYTAGAKGWVKVTLAPDEPWPLELLQKWVDESYRLIAPKQLVATLP